MEKVASARQPLRTVSSLSAHIRLNSDPSDRLRLAIGELEEAGGVALCGTNAAAAASLRMCG